MLTDKKVKFQQFINRYWWGKEVELSITNVDLNQPIIDRWLVGLSILLVLLVLFSLSSL